MIDVQIASPEYLADLARTQAEVQADAAREARQRRANVAWTRLDAAFEAARTRLSFSPEAHEKWVKVAEASANILEVLAQAIPGQPIPEDMEPEEPKG